MRRATAARIALGAGVLLAGAWLSEVLWGGEDLDWARVERGSLVVSVPLEGSLRAVDSSSFGPPEVAGLWDFKIAMLAPEGQQVEVGEPVLGFDTSELERKLQEQLAEAQAAEKEIEQRRVQSELERARDALRLAEADSRRRKAALKVEVPEELASARELAEARLELELAEREIAYLRKRIEASARGTEAAMKRLRARRDRARGRVEEIRRAIASMTVRAPRAGTVVYVTDWRGDKKKIGDSCWRGEPVLEIPDLGRLEAEATVDEAHGARVRPGQRVHFRLDAYPDETYGGRIASVSDTVRRKHWNDPQKVVGLRIELDTTDPRRMRPGMRLRGAVEIERVEDVLTIPKESVFFGPAGPVVYRRRWGGYEVVPVELGRWGEHRVEVLSGLRAGDAVARREPPEREEDA